MLLLLCLCCQPVLICSSLSLASSCGGSLYPHLKSFSPLMIAICVNTRIALTTLPCRESLLKCRNMFRRMLQSFSLLLIVSCLFRTLCCMNKHSSRLTNDLGHLQCNGALPINPSSHSAHSASSSSLIKASRKMLMSGHLPQGCGPFIQTTSPV